MIDEKKEQNLRELYIKKWTDLLADADEGTRKKILEKQLKKWGKIWWLGGHENITAEAWKKYAEMANDPDIKDKADYGAEKIKESLKDDIDFLRIWGGYDDNKTGYEVQYNLGAIRYLLEGEWTLDTLDIV